MKKLLFTVYQADSGYIAEVSGAVLADKSMSKVCRLACMTVARQLLGLPPPWQKVQKSEWRKL